MILSLSHANVLNENQNFVLFHLFIFCTIFYSKKLCPIHLILPHGNVITYCIYSSQPILGPFVNRFPKHSFSIHTTRKYSIVKVFDCNEKNRFVYYSQAGKIAGELYAFVDTQCVYGSFDNKKFVVSCFQASKQASKQSGHLTM